MIQLEKYNEFLKIFEYAHWEWNDEAFYKSRTILMFGTETIPDPHSLFADGEKAIKLVQLLFNQVDVAKMKYYNENTFKIFRNAKAELLGNFFNIPNKEDRSFFITHILNEYYPVQDRYFQIHDEIYNIDDYTLTNISSEDGNEEIEKIYKEYIFGVCYAITHSWSMFIKELVFVNDIKLQPQSIPCIDNWEMKELYKATFSKETGLKKYLKIPSQYDSIMSLEGMRMYFTKEGYPIGKAQKGELSAFLHFLNDYGYLKEKYLKTKELVSIGYELYQLRPDVMKKPKSTDLFLFILNEVPVNG